MSKKNIAIIGGGFIGLCSAYYLSEQGHQVTIVDKDIIGDACSLGNAGILVPSHFIPYVTAGLFANGPQAMTDNRSAFQANLDNSAESHRWFDIFRSCANGEHAKYCAEILRDLHGTSKELFEEIREGSGFDFVMVNEGLLVVYRTKEVEEEEIEVAHMGRELGYDIEILSAEEVQERNPGFRIDVRGGVLFKSDAHIHPGDFMQSMMTLLHERGVEMIDGCPVEAFEEGKPGQITALFTPKGRIVADEFIVASGAWSGELLKQLNIQLPMRSGKGYSVTLSEPCTQSVMPLILAELRGAITPMGDSMRLGGTMELCGVDLSINQEKIDMLYNRIPEYLPDFPAELTTKEEIWSGLRPCSPDGLPYIGRLDGFSNLIAATGHAMLGISMGPITGKLVSEIVAGEETTLPIEQLNPNRYRDI